MEEDLLNPQKLNKPTLDDDNEVVRFMREQPPGHCTLRVESFSQLQDTHLTEYGDHFDSTEFKAGGYRWVLTVYPNGNKKEHGDGYLSLYVRMIDKLGCGSPVSAALRFFIHDQMRDKYLTILDIREKRFQAIKNEWGISKVLPLSSFTDPSNGYLVNDGCILGAEVLVINVENNVSEVSILKPTSNWKYTWRINKYSELVKDQSYSPVFTFEGWSWKLSLYPRGCGDAEEKSLSLFLTLSNSCKLKNGSKLFVKYELRVKNQLKKGSDRQKIGLSWFSSTPNVWGFRFFLPLSYVNNSQTGFLVDDVMIIEVEFKKLFLLKGVEKGITGSSVKKPVV